MRLLHKLRRRKRDKKADASAAAAVSLLLPALPFHDDDKLADSGEDKGTQTSNDSGYGSTENASPTLATTPAELSASEEHSSPDVKFAQLVNLEQDVVNRRRRESIRFELFGTDDDDGEEGEAQEGESTQSAARPPPPRPRLNICTSVAGRRPPAAITPVSADSPHPQAYRPPPTWYVFDSADWVK